MLLLHDSSKECPQGSGGISAPNSFGVLGLVVGHSRRSRKGKEVRSAGCRPELDRVMAELGWTESGHADQGRERLIINRRLSWKTDSEEGRDWSVAEVVM
jgi:hypothetical protein